MRQKLRFTAVLVVLLIILGDSILPRTGKAAEAVIPGIAGSCGDGSGRGAGDSAGDDILYRV